MDENAKKSTSHHLFELQVHGSSAQQQDDIMMDTDDNTRCGDLGTGSASKALPGPLYGPDMELM